MRWLFSSFYNVVLVGVIAVSLPKIMRRLLKNGDSLRGRLGWGIEPLEKGERKLIWVHAVSLGETKSVVPLVEKLRAAYDNPLIVVSTITPTGQAEAQRAMPWADRHLYLPIDFSCVMRRLLHRIRPDVVVVTETDYWYHFLSSAREAGAKIVVVNGKLSERSASRFARFPWFSHHLFGLFDHICIQSEEYRPRFLSVGVPPERITVTGNLKFDATLPVMSDEECSAFRARLGLQCTDRVITVGSTHYPEEQIIVDAIRPLLAADPTLKLLLVPRHPERFDAVANWLQEQGLPTARLSAHTPVPSDARIILIDAMGVLKECYQVSDVAIVAGSFTEAVGGHNILEPCHYSVPVIFGPYMHSQPEMERLVLQAHAGIQTTVEELSQTLSSLLNDSQQRQALASAATALIQANRGAVQRTLGSF